MNLLEAVTITAVNGDCEDVTSTMTDPDGTYMLSGLMADAYRVEFSKTGFADAVVEDVSVNAGEAQSDVDAVLAVD